MATPLNPIDFITRLRALRPQREEQEPIVIPPVEELSQQYDEQFAEGPALSSYREHIQSMPEYEDYKPSFARKLVAGLVGAGLQGERGVNFAQETVNQPYHEAVSRWSMKTAPLRESAQLEEFDSRTKRKYIDDARETALRQQKQQIEQDQQGNEFNRKLLDLERSYFDNQNRTQDRDEDRAARIEAAKATRADAAARMGETQRHNREMENIARGNLDARKNPPVRPTAPLRVTPERQSRAYKQAMQELIDNPMMADFIERKNGKFTGFRESVGGLFTSKRKPNLQLNGRPVSPADYVKARTEEILKRMNEEPQFEDLGFEP